MELIGDAWRVAALGASAGVELRSSDLPLISRYDAVISITMFRRLARSRRHDRGEGSSARGLLDEKGSFVALLLFFVTFPITCLPHVVRRASRSIQGIRVWAAWLCWMSGRDLDRAGVG